MRLMFANNGGYTTQRRTKARSMADTCQAGASRKELMRCLVLSKTYITIEKRRIRTRLSRETLKDLSLSQLPSFMDRLQLIQEYLIIRACSVFRFEPLQNFHSGASKILKECTFTYL